MNHMTFAQITSLQKDYNVTEIQQQINSGLVWKLEGSVGRFASDMLEAGACMLPLERKIDYYGQVVPSRNDLKSGTKGTFQNAARFWQKVMNFDIDAVEWLESTFAR
jgi:ABC-type cobalamin transport system ATPase subunit